MDGAWRDEVIWERILTDGRRQPGRGHTGRRPTPGPASMPPGHRPPPGLGPLSPSERFLSTEAARGLRELQQFLAERAA